MERLRQFHSIYEMGNRIRWEGRRFLQQLARPFGAVGIILLGCFGIIIAAVKVRQDNQSQYVQLRAKSIALPSTTYSIPVVQKKTARAKLAAFDDHLVSHDQIPAVVQDLIKLAGKSHIALLRGEYKTEVDTQGRFIRFHMTFPVKGQPQFVYQFMEEALHDHKTLALSSVQFKRERIDANEVEARIQWMLMTKLPSVKKVTDIKMTAVGEGS